MVYFTSSDQVFGKFFCLDFRRFGNRCTVHGTNGLPGYNRFAGCTVRDCFVSPAQLEYGNFDCECVSKICCDLHGCHHSMQGVQL